MTGTGPRSHVPTQVNDAPLDPGVNSRGTDKGQGDNGVEYICCLAGFRAAPSWLMLRCSKGSSSMQYTFSRCSLCGGNMHAQ